MHVMNVTATWRSFLGNLLGNSWARFRRAFFGSVGCWRWSSTRPWPSSGTCDFSAENSRNLSKFCKLIALPFSYTRFFAKFAFLLAFLFPCTFPFRENFSSGLNPIDPVGGDSSLLSIWPCVPVGRFVLRSARLKLCRVFYWSEVTWTPWAANPKVFWLSCGTISFNNEWRRWRKLNI